MSQIKIACKTGQSLPLRKLKILQGELKSLSDENYEKLKREIVDTGFAFPPHVWRDTKSKQWFICDGTQRTTALLRMVDEGFEIDEVPVVVIEAKDMQEAKRRVLQATSQYGFMTENSLANFMNDAGLEMSFLNDKFDLPNIDMDSFTNNFVVYEGKIVSVAEHQRTIGLTDENEVPEVKKSRVKLGDIWLLGDHRLMCGDSTDKATVEKIMNGEKADMVFTDPPYELETKGGGLLKESLAMKKIKELGIDKFNPDSLELYAESNVFCCNKPLVKKYIELAEKNKVAYDIAVYHKQNITPNYGGHLMTDIEYLLVIGKQAPRTGIGEDKSLYSKLYSGGKDQDNETAWSKPVALCEKFIKLYSEKSVLDLFGGSGSTLIACEKTNRKCFMMELDPHYCTVIIERWENFTGKKAIKHTKPMLKKRALPHPHA